MIQFYKRYKVTITISILVMRLMSANTVENMPLISTEFNQSGSDFMCFNQKHDNSHYRDHLETQDEDGFESTFHMASIKNSTIIKDHILEIVHAVMDFNQLSAKVSSKLNAMLLTSNLKTSKVLSCDEVCYHASGQSYVKDKEKIHIVCNR